MSYAQRYIEKRRQRRTAPAPPAEQPRRPMAAAPAVGPPVQPIEPDSVPIGSSNPEPITGGEYPADYQLIDGAGSNAQRYSHRQRIASLSPEEIRAELAQHRAILDTAMLRQSVNRDNENFRHWASAQYYIRFCEDILNERI